MVSFAVISASFAVVLLRLTLSAPEQILLEISAARWLGGQGGEEPPQIMVNTAHYYNRSIVYYNYDHHMTGGFGTPALPSSLKFLKCWRTYSRVLVLTGVHKRSSVMN